MNFYNGKHYKKFIGLLMKFLTFKNRNNNPKLAVYLHITKRCEYTASLIKKNIKKVLTNKKNMI